MEGWGAAWAAGQDGGVKSGAMAKEAVEGTHTAEGPKAGWFTPMLLAASIERSIEFYRKLGFELIDTEGGEAGCPIGWARMHCQGGAVMFLLANEPDNPPNPEKTTVMFTLYAADLAEMRRDLIAQNVECPAISYPEYMPSGSMQVRDPDGYRIDIVHWGEEEHAAWLKKIGRERVCRN